MSTWYSVDTPEEATRLLGAWPDAPTENTELCGMLLSTAEYQVLTYGTTGEDIASTLTQALLAAGYDQETVDAVLVLLDVDNPPTPERWVYAQLQQAKNLWNAGRVSSDGDVGADGFVFSPRPLDKTIRGIILPPSGAVDVL
jgi:hypothetical protein